MSSRPCAAGCGTMVSGRRKSCSPSCRNKVRAKAERVRYHTDRDQDPADYDHAAEVVSYAHGGASAPGILPPVTHRDNPRHDWVTRQRLERQAQADDDEPEMTSWSAMIGQPRNAGRYADFHGSSDGVDLRGRGDVPPVDNWSVLGQAFRPDPAIALAAIHEHVSARFGGRVSPPGRR